MGDAFSKLQAVGLGFTALSTQIRLRRALEKSLFTSS